MECCRKTINLLNFNKDEDNMFYVKELEKASADNKWVDLSGFVFSFPSNGTSVRCRLKVTHILSQAGDAWTGRRGTLSDDLLQDLVGTSNPDAFVYTCGPQEFIQLAKK